jgi:AcrR family transcriptional regulator
VKQQEFPAAPPVPTLLARKQELVRDAIWNAAIDLFAESGFDETTVDEIAQAAGVSPRTFFRYFSSKHDLLAKGVIPLGVALGEAIGACPSDYSASEAMRAAVLDVARKAAAYPRTAKILEITRKYPAARQAQMSRMAELQSEVAQAYARRMSPLKRGDITPSVLAAMTVTLFDIILRTWLETGQQDISATIDKVLTTARGVLA